MLLECLPGYLWVKVKLLKFYRTNILVVCTGLFHGLFLLPIIIRSFAFGVGDTVNKKDDLKKISGNKQNALVGLSNITKVEPIDDVKNDETEGKRKNNSNNGTTNNNFYNERDLGEDVERRFKQTCGNF